MEGHLLPQAAATCLFLLLLLLFLFLLLLLPTACLRAASPDPALPGPNASPAALYRVGVRGTLVHLLLSAQSLPVTLTAVLLPAAQCRQG